VGFEYNHFGRWESHPIADGAPGREPQHQSILDIHYIPVGIEVVGKLSEALQHTDLGQNRS